MRTKTLAIILVLTMLILATGPVYSAGPHPRIGSGSGHPWEGFTDGPGGHPSPVSYGHQLVMGPIFSDFFVGIYLKGVFREKEHAKKPVRIGDNSYQIFFSW